MKSHLNMGCVSHSGLRLQVTRKQKLKSARMQWGTARGYWLLGLLLSLSRAMTSPKWAWTVLHDITYKGQLTGYESH